jgi:hypothetical protein
VNAANEHPVEKADEAKSSTHGEPAHAADDHAASEKPEGHEAVAADVPAEDSAVIPEPIDPAHEVH